MNGEKEKIVWEPAAEYGEVEEFWKKKKVFLTLEL